MWVSAPGAGGSVACLYGALTQMNSGRTIYYLITAVASATVQCTWTRAAIGEETAAGSGLVEKKQKEKNQEGKSRKARTRNEKKEKAKKKKKETQKKKKKKKKKGKGKDGRPAKAAGR